MSVAMNDWIRRHRITVDEYYRMAEGGILSPDARVELIEGVIIDMAPIGFRHGAAVMHLNRLLVEAVGTLAEVLPQSAVRLSDISEPQPDFTLLKPHMASYKRRLPGPGDTLLLVEVSDSSLRYDLEVKSQLYALHNLPEYWLIDLTGRQVHFFRSPASGRYTDVTSTSEPGIVAPGLLPAARIDLSGILAD